MFEIDTYTFSTLWPSLAMIAAMSVVMAYGAYKAVKLMKDAEKEQNK